MSDSLPLVHDVDYEFYDREISSFIPDKIYDAHTHLYHENHYTPGEPGFPSTVDWQSIES
ncbi:MAG: hypothetical protein R3C11_28825 [Planctomycetaceae bacterium]